MSMVSGDMARSSDIESEVLTDGESKLLRRTQLVLLGEATPQGFE